MKLPAVLYAFLVLLNLLSLGFIIGVFMTDGINRYTASTLDRFTAYLFYITVLSNLYGLFYIAVKNKFHD